MLLALLLLAAPQKPVLEFLDEVVAWSRQARSPAADQPAEVVYGDASEKLARQGLSLAFEAAHGEAALQTAQPAGKPVDAQLAQAQAQVKSLQDEIDSMTRELAVASPAKRADLVQRIAETKSELQLAQVRQQTVGALADFAGKAAGTGLAAQIDELQASVPESQPNAAAPPRTASDATHRPAPSGLVALASELINVRRKQSQLKDAAALTTRLAAETQARKAPLVDDLRHAQLRGDQLATEADTSAGADLQRRARDIDDLTAHFRKVSAALVPLGKLQIVLETEAGNLNQWRASIDSEDNAILRTLLLRLGLLVLAISALLAASSFWRRATFRYVHDQRRRQQSLLIRRIAVTVALIFLVTFSLMTEFGSIATFAGFITAGLAVALQNVILSVAAYFFLIGRYGIRVGDRVQISGVTGDVMDIGLVRLHLMELGPDGQSTGRVTVFSNSVFFQPSSGFFKQIPGSNFAWHQVVLTLSPETDFRGAEKQLVGAVDRVFQGYKERIVRAHEAMEENLTLDLSTPGPQSTLRLAGSGLELTIRFPVPLELAATVDDQVTRAVLDTLAHEPGLRLRGSGLPVIEPVPDATH